MDKPITHPVVTEHIMVLEEYFKVQKELFDLLREEPVGEFEENSYRVKLMELDMKMNQLSQKLSESVVKLGGIPYTDYRNMT